MCVQSTPVPGSDMLILSVGITEYLNRTWCPLLQGLCQCRTLAQYGNYSQLHNLQVRCSACVRPIEKSLCIKNQHLQDDHSLLDMRGNYQYSLIGSAYLALQFKFHLGCEEYGNFSDGYGKFWCRGIECYIIKVVCCDGRSLNSWFLCRIL